METFVNRENLDGDITFKCSLLGNHPSWEKPNLARISTKLRKSIVNMQFWTVFAGDCVQLKAFFPLLKLVFPKLNFPLSFI